MYTGGQYRIRIINGPNLNMLGIREPQIYGAMTLGEICARIREAATDLPADLDFFQSNHEGSIVDQVQNTYFESLDGAVINPGALTHYSYAVRDAIAAVPVPFVEVHLSDVSQREEFRRTSVTAPVCLKQIAGHGWRGYVEALECLVRFLSGKEKSV